MNKGVKLIATSFLLILIIALGFYRDLLFKTINSELKDLYYQTEYYTIPDSLLFLQSLSYHQLYYLKWILTPIISLIYLGLFLLTVKIHFKEKRYLYFTVIAFAAIVIISGLFFLSGMLFNDIYKGYHFSRIFMGFVQSPLLLMILIPAFLLERKSI
jgi:hypothetical protein